MKYTLCMFFNDWFSLFRVFVVSICAYIALICLLNVSGKRTLSKLNAFDFVVTVALGSTLATVLLSKETALLEGVLALAMLIFLQYGVAWLSVRSPWFGRLVKSEPKLLFFRGQYLEQELKVERVTQEEILAVVREQGIPTLEQVEAVVLETAGTMSVLRRPGEGAATTLSTVSRAREIAGVGEKSP